MHIQSRFPYDMADAYRTATDPSRHGCHPAVIQTNWCFMKEARGQRVHIERLAITGHLIRPAAQDITTAAELLSFTHCATAAVRRRRDEVLSRHTHGPEDAA